MSLPKISFSHRYSKLSVIGKSTNEDPSQAILVSVQEVELSRLPMAFLSYDTDFGKYKLPKKGKYLLLLFLSYGGLFTTLRRSYPEAKRQYYEKKIGESFEIVFTPA